MKIVLIGSLYPPYAFGGAEKAIAMLAEALVRRGHNVVVVTLHRGHSEGTEERNGLRIEQRNRTRKNRKKPGARRLA